MKKKKLKIWVKVIIILFIAIGIFLLIPKNKENKNDKKNTDQKVIEQKIDYVLEVSKKLSDIDIDFLKWVNEKYDSSLENLNKRLEKEEYDEEMWHDITGYSYIVLNDLYTKKYDNMDNVKILEVKTPSTISIVGDISLADNWYIMPKYDERGGVNGILSESVLKIMTESDLMVANSEFTVSNRGTKMSGKQYTFRAKPERLKIYDEMGVDLVTLANNHVYDFGRDAFLDMLDAFDEYKIPHIGAGHNLDEAKKAYYFIINGYKFAFLNGTRAEKYILTPGANENSEGVFRCYDPTNMINEIKKVKEESDFVVTIMHFGKEGSHELEKEQVESAKKYIDAGSDIIVGHHAHVLQGIEFYKDKPIIYNLGDFIFNGNVEDTAIFQVKIGNNKEMEYYILPCQQKNMFTNLLDGKEKERLIKDMNSWSVNGNVDENGKITKK